MPVLSQERPRMFDADLNQLRSVRERTLALIQPLSQAQLNYSPGRDRWSISEIADHVSLALGMVQRDLSELARLKRAGLPAEVTRTFADMNAAPACIPQSMLPLLEMPFSIFSGLVPRSVRTLLIRQRFLPFRAATQAAPTKGKPANQLRSELMESFAKTEAVFETDPTLDFRELISHHPLLGTNNALQLLEFAANHERRHQAQIEGILPEFTRTA